MLEDWVFLLKLRSVMMRRSLFRFSCFTFDLSIGDSLANVSDCCALLVAIVNTSNKKSKAFLVILKLFFDWLFLGYRLSRQK